MKNWDPFFSSGRNIDKFDYAREIDEYCDDYINSMSQDWYDFPDFSFGYKKDDKEEKNGFELILQK